MKKGFAAGWHELRSREQGFTLLELLVGMLIMSILMATASMYYFHQRRKGWEAQVHASVRHMAGAENNFLYGEGALAFTSDLDDLHLTGYRWNEKWVRPYVALATRETYCIQVHSTRDPSIVWHFSSIVGRPERGPATPASCGDPQVLGVYIAGLPDASYGRDGVPSSVAAGVVASNDPTAGGGSTRNGGGSTGGGSGTTSGTTGGTAGEDESNTGEYVSSEPSDGGSDGSRTTDGSSGAGSTTGCEGDSTGGGSTTGTNHPSGKDRDEESGGSSDQGTSGSDPDGDENDGADKPGQDGGANSGDQDGNNGSGNDTDFEDDNQGPDRDGTPTPGTGC